MDRFDGRTDSALVTSSSLCIGGINSSGAIGGGLTSKCSGDPPQARSSCTSNTGRSPCADTGAARELQDRKATSSESNARKWKPVRGRTRGYKEETPRQRFSCCLFRVGRGWWCDTRITSDSQFARHCKLISINLAVDVGDAIITRDMLSEFSSPWPSFFGSQTAHCPVDRNLFSEVSVRVVRVPCRSSASVRGFLRVARGKRNGRDGGEAKSDNQLDGPRRRRSSPERYFQRFWTI
jgi:hypothetical protein